MTRVWLAVRAYGPPQQDLSDAALEQQLDAAPKSGAGHLTDAASSPAAVRS